MLACVCVQSKQQANMNRKKESTIIIRELAKVYDA